MDNSQNDFKAACEKARQEGYEKGYQAGVLDTHNAYETECETARQLGYAEGLEAGRQIGYAYATIPKPEIKKGETDG